MEPRHYGGVFVLQKFAVGNEAFPPQNYNIFFFEKYFSKALDFLKEM